MPSPTLLFHFDEPDGVGPRDAMGNLDDLHLDGALAKPSLVENTFTGRGRLFESGNNEALIAADLAGKDTLLQRDVTVQAIISMIRTDSPHVLICRGKGNSAAERVSFGIALHDDPDFADNVQVFFFHQTPAGVAKPQPAAVIRPVDGKFFLLTCTRRWESQGKIVCRYYVGEQLVAELESADGDIGGGTTGTTIVGCEFTGGAYASFFNGVIDELKVTDYEMSHEEVRHTWRRLTEYQPAGVAMFTALAPRGIEWGKNPGSSLGRRVKVAGQSLGIANAGAEELRAMLLPDVPPLGIIERWERICSLSPLPRDSLDVRRARLVAYLAREEGLSLPAIRATLASPLALAAADVELLEYTNQVTDGFTAIATERWFVAPTADWAIVGGNEIEVTVPVASNLNWAVSNLGWHIRTPLDTDGKRIYVSSKLATWTLENDAGVGILLTNRRTQDTLWFGLLQTAGTIQLGWRRVLAGVVGAFNVLVTPAAGGPYWLRIFSSQTAGYTQDGVLTAAWSTVGPNAGFTEQAIATGVIGVDYAGYAAFGTKASLAAQVKGKFDDFLAFCADGHRPFLWYAYRNPALAGVPDMVGAHLLVQKIKPAHTYASAIQSKSVLCNDARDGLCDLGPLGSL